MSAARWPWPPPEQEEERKLSARPSVVWERMVARLEEPWSAAGSPPASLQDYRREKKSHPSEKRCSHLRRRRAFFGPPFPCVLSLLRRPASSLPRWLGDAPGCLCIQRFRLSRPTGERIFESPPEKAHQC